MSKVYSRDDAALAIGKALDGAKVFEASTDASAPGDVATMLEDAAQAQGVELTLHMAPKGVLIAHAQHAAAV